MNLTLASIAPRAGTGPAQLLFETYLTRLRVFASPEAPVFRSEAAFFEHVAKQRARRPPWVVLLDSRGTQLSSEGIAQAIAHERDGGRQAAVFAIGPADGWSPQARTRADLLLSLGLMTLPHELARVVAAEQVYRAFTILAGHPYHSGHA